MNVRVFWCCRGGDEDEFRCVVAELRDVDAAFSLRPQVGAAAMAPRMKARALPPRKGIASIKTVTDTVWDDPDIPDGEYVRGACTACGLRARCGVGVYTYRIENRPTGTTHRVASL